jgi:hypothetical protein
MAIRVEKNKYLYTHGKQPRGTGQWVFKIKGVEYWFKGSYSVAKVKALKKAKELGAFEVIVMP